MHTYYAILIRPDTRPLIQKLMGDDRLPEDLDEHYYLIETDLEEPGIVLTDEQFYVSHPNASPWSHIQLVAIQR